MGRGSREIVKLCSSSRTGHFYTTMKNKRAKFKKMQLKKFDPIVRRHVVYVESK